ncbi:DUF6350 family protein [Galbitalea sp. SE-J8]|uniref:cell division protein PerM n=1 Tax=Galbitalea sp. SE-J8 TaxID=3054952 RepID=UPI00259C76B8|nr:DUF6350 family protein [Galbitalea sp. SE-J8]MDM4761410.1 DUF6350 family protein [Galbitalea sp. SE-J8]
MNRPLTAVFAALEALLVVGVGVGIPLAMLTIVWAVQFGFALDWGAFWRAGVDTWLVGHGVDVSIALDPATASALGLAGSDARFAVSIAALGFAGLTLALAVRAGRRVAETRFRVFGEVVAIGTFAVLSLGLALTAQHPAASTDIAQAVIAPTLVFAVGVVVGSLRTRRAEGDDNGSSLRDWVADWRPETRDSWRAVLAGGAFATASVVLVAALLVAVLLVAGYARIITLYESLHAEVLGGIALTLGQLALLPDLVVWAASWLVGPGFALGTGSTVSPVGTSLGPVPAIPVLGALPEGALAWGFVGLAIPVVAAFLAGLVVHPRLAEHAPPAPGRIVAVGLGIGIVGGALLGLLAWLASGSVGPGRLADVGPDAFAVGGFAALEFAAASVIALAVASRRSRG